MINKIIFVNLLAKKMKNLFYILIIFLIVIPTSKAMACGNSSKKPDIQQTSCNHKNEKKSEKKSCCNSEKKGDNHDCKGDCNNTNCHCPISTNVPLPVNNFIHFFTTLIVAEDTNWDYVQNRPISVYLSIWQPPKIS